MESNKVNSNQNKAKLISDNLLAHGIIFISK